MHESPILALQLRDSPARAARNLQLQSDLVRRQSSPPRSRLELSRQQIEAEQTAADSIGMAALTEREDVRTGEERAEMA